MRRGAITAAGLCLVAGAAPAHAVTVTGASNFPEGSGIVVTVVGDPEANEVTLERRDGSGDLLVRDAAATPTRAAGLCRELGSGDATCPAPIDAIRVGLGGAGDRLRSGFPDAPGLEVDGESGSDRIEILRRAARTRTKLRGGRQDDTLVGSERRDRLIGARGADVLRGASGRDVLIGDGEGGPAEHDVLIGGRGHDAASWGDRGQPVRADLRKGSGGAPGDEDELRSIEDLWGGRADDVLVGGDGANGLRGGGGEDELHGNDGDDVLDGGVTRQGDLDNDLALDGLHCGAGVDTVLNVARQGTRRLDVIPQDCERLRLGAWLLEVPRLKLGATSVTVEIECPAVRGNRRVNLVSRGSELGHSRTVSYDDPTCRTDRIDVPLDRPLEDGPPIRVGIHGTDRRSDAPPEPYSRHYRLSRPDA